MKRGDVVKVAHGSGATGKPRPAVIVQSDIYLDTPSVLIVPLSSDLTELAGLRPVIEPDSHNRLRLPSMAMVNVVAAVPRGRIGGVVGAMTAADMARIDVALMIVMGLA